MKYLNFTLLYLFLFLSITKILVAIEPHSPPLISNAGNLCYLDSTFQCLYQIKPLTHFLLTQGKNFYKENTIASHLVNFIEKVQNLPTRKTIKEPPDFCFPVFEKFFARRAFTQEDASELLQGILDSLGDVDIKNEKKGPIKYNIPANFVTDLFRITFKENLQFQDPGKCPMKLESKISSLLMAQLIIKSKDKSFDNLDECFENTYAEEVIKDYKCEITNKEATLVKQVRFYELPTYLILHLKRFEIVDFDNEGNAITEKNNDNIKFGLEIDLKKYLDPESKETNTKYELISFIEHGGTTKEGHYTAYVKHNNEWFYVDDIPATSNKIDVNDIKKVETIGRISNKTPYILFYKRKGANGIPEETLSEKIERIKNNILKEIFPKLGKAERRNFRKILEYAQEGQGLILHRIIDNLEKNQIEQAINSIRTAYRGSYELGYDFTTEEFLEIWQQLYPWVYKKKIERIKNNILKEIFPKLGKAERRNFRKILEYAQEGQGLILHRIIDNLEKNQIEQAINSIRTAYGGSYELGYDFTTEEFLEIWQQLYPWVYKKKM